MKSYFINGQNIYIDRNTGDFSNSVHGLVPHEPNESTFVYASRKIVDQGPLATFCINLSNNCNLCCDYCFNRTKSDNSISVSDAVLFLESCFSCFPGKERYIVDVSGKGEPLLFLEKIIQINDYCKK